jgi:hypothetical protein
MMAFSDLDTDGNGELSQEEFAAFDASAWYSSLDADASGNVSQDEFDTFVSTMSTDSSSTESTQ